MTVETVADVPEDMALVTGGREVQDLLESAGVSDQVDRRVGAFVETDRGEVVTLYVFPGHVPYLHKSVRQLV
jgi:hypothetical protein